MHAHTTNSVEHSIDEVDNLHGVLSACKDKKILFAELGPSSKADTKMMCTLFKFIVLAMNYKWFLIISNSSGGLSTVNSKEADGSKVITAALSIRAKCKFLESKNFNEKEAKAFCNHFNVEDSIPPKVYYNPLYLSFYNDSLNDPARLTTACNSITRVRDAFVRDLSQQFKDYGNACKIGKSLNLLKCALGGIPIDNKLRIAYDTSFLWNEHLTYVDEQNTTDFLLKLYDPEKGYLLLDTFDSFVSNIKDKKCTEFLKIPAVMGYQFEEFILDELMILCITATYPAKKKEDEYVTWDFSITERCKHLKDPLKVITPGTMYHLRTGHHSIDGIFLAENSTYLIFLQVSLSSYIDHESKAKSIEGLISTLEDPNWPQIVDYYVNLVEKCNGNKPTPIYVFLSPNEICVPGNKFDDDMKRPISRRFPSGISTRGIHYGLVTLNSATHVTIQAVLQTMKL